MSDGSRTVHLEKMKFSVLSKLPVEFIDAEVDVSFGELFCIDQMILRIKGFVWGEELEPRTIKYPRDWWQAFKQRWFPEWALKRWPVMNTTLHISAAILYPGIVPSINGRNWHVQIAEIMNTKVIEP